VSRVDLQGSRNFLAKLGVGGRRTSLRGGEGKDAGGGGKLRRAVDCGAGIGRITEGLLLSIADTVDIIEPIAKFSDSLKGKPGIGRIWNIGLEEWDFDGDNVHESMRYDLIWNQWCLGHLTDAQLVQYLMKCGRALRAGGWIVVKENMSTGKEDIFDEIDSSVTRVDDKFRKIFQEAGMNIKRTELQKGMPKELYPVRIYALQPVA